MAIRNNNAFGPGTPTTPVSSGVEEYGATTPVNNGGMGETLPPQTPYDIFDQNYMNGGIEETGETKGVEDVFGPEGFAPVVGWLVCIEGVSEGADYRIHAGYNYIGRSDSMDICIKGDDTIGRERHAMLAYDHEERLFFFGPADGRSIVRKNGKVVMVPTELNAYDEIRIGSTKLMFVPLCGEKFNWRNM